MKLSAKCEAIIEEHKDLVLEVLGDEYKRIPQKEIFKRGRLRAGEIVNGLVPVPRTYNSRAVNASFALAFLYCSPYFYDFVRIMRNGWEPLTFSNFHFEDTSEIIIYMLGTFDLYLRESMAMKAPAELISDISTYDKKFRDEQTVGNGYRVVLIDVLNSPENVSAEVAKIVRSEQEALSKQFSDMLDSLPEEIDREIFQRRDPVNLFAYTAGNKDSGQTRRPETVWPMWHKAFWIYFYKEEGLKEKEIIGKIYNIEQDSDSYAGKKSTISNHYKLAKKLMFSAFIRSSLSSASDW